ncbi:MAG: Mannose-1-phosphate guanylyltransferase/mannose-6-phosphate isomerase [Candidatus Wolfebacteria bacterium GW2011_GWA1_44_24]|uniref:mannose-1-phosphate guanylyltransferase n=1 Tax=Candidatus Wolfebacteria bacterium GW2011_GWB1_41_12 TaxID=1619006 RepID=A0A0G0UK46_9BACT|nr:MAG: Mannose-1-phosphate guanylyltransferase/mannose-6-phosphate isomerase [Candidatus Wolfebacteria bacterium GW2011_GWB1_41_12]KKT56665.1 MAG: Mannose-1-phosphate guanylyltransferase/mannose-6-phosphate isomerase [Candidatus Wolfebacteria bacterium GW2011_GWA1_44_24]
MAKQNESAIKNLYGVILGGGSGARLWPVSRKFYPKQLLKLFGDKTLIQQTFLRLKKIIKPSKIYVVTNAPLADDIYIQLKEFGFKKENFIIESAQKSTAPAIALAASRVFKENRKAIMAVCPADHLIKPDKKFIETIKESLKPAKEGFLVVFGIKPVGPSAEYGYLKTDRKSKSKIQTVEKFTEKPDEKTAERFIKEGYFWNSGIFVWKAEVFLKEVKKHLPKVYRALKFPGFYKSIDSISVDSGVLEKSKKIKAISANFKWQDVGSWKSLYGLLPKDSNQNVIGENIFGVDCQKCLIYGTQRRIVAAVGLKDLIVVDTEDAVLVAHREKSGEIKNILEQIKANNLSQYFEHPTVHRPWGFFTVIEEGEKFKVKKVSVKPKEKLSLQYHNKRSEHWVVLRGTAKILLDGKVFFLETHQSFDIPVGGKHQLENPGDEPLELIETQSGDYLGEDDIVRINDKYGR